MAGLHIDYRPRSFDEMLGNEQTIKEIKNVLAKENKPHVFLLTGRTGTGKTTIGRIVANELGCKGLDLQEIDFADFRGIDTVREIKRNMCLKPISGSCRVWILDEIQKASGDAQSALLKAFEDTPEHVFFILCTTDPEKLLATIRGRCTQFTTSVLSDELITQLVAEVSQAEGAEIPEKIIHKIAEKSQGHPRNALVELDKILGLDAEDMEAALALQEDIDMKVIDLCKALVKKSSWKKVASILDNLKEDPEKIKQAVLGYFDRTIKTTNDEALQARSFLIMQSFIDRSFLYSGKYALTVSCYEALYNG